MNIVCLMGKSGAGKSSIERNLEKLGFHRLVSYTTRDIREGEVDGIDYNYVSVTEFRRLEALGYFMETATYAGNLYGSPKPMGDKNNVIVVESDGYHQIKACMGKQAIGIYIAIPTAEAFKRMQNRISGVLDMCDVEARMDDDSTKFKGIEAEVDLVVNGTQSLETQTAEVLQYIRNKETLGKV